MIDIKNEGQLIEYATSNNWAHLFFVDRAHYFVTPQGTYVSVRIRKDGSLYWADFRGSPTEGSALRWFGESE